MTRLLLSKTFWRGVWDGFTAAKYCLKANGLTDDQIAYLHERAEERRRGWREHACEDGVSEDEKNG